MTESAHAALALATSLQQDGRASEAESAYVGIVDSRQTASSVAAAAHNNLAALLRHRGAAEAAEDHWQAAIDLVPTYVEAHNNLASSFILSHEPARAWRALNRAVTLVPHFGALYARLGAVLTRGEQLGSLPLPTRRRVASLARMAAALSPGDATLWCNFGLALASLGRMSHSARAYERAIRANPLSVDARLGLAAAQPSAEAASTLRAAIALGPSVAGGPFSLGRAYHNLGNLLHHGRYDELHEARRRAAAETGVTSRAVADAGGERRLAAARAAAAAVAVEATRCFDAAAALDPSLVDAHYNAGLAPQQAHVDTPRHSLAAYRRALALVPSEPKVLSRLITTLQWAGRRARPPSRSPVSTGRVVSLMHCAHPYSHLAPPPCVLPARPPCRSSPSP